MLACLTTCSQAWSRLYVSSGHWPADNNPLVNAPHTASDLTAEQWDYPYSRIEAVFPGGESQSQNKYWPPVSRVDNVYGDKHLICSCPPLSSYEPESEEVDNK